MVCNLLLTVFCSIPSCPPILRAVSCSIPSCPPVLRAVSRFSSCPSFSSPLVAGGFLTCNGTLNIGNLHLYYVIFLLYERTHKLGPNSCSWIRHVSKSEIYLSETYSSGVKITFTAMNKKYTTNPLHMQENMTQSVNQ